MAPGGPYLETMETLETPETPDEGVVQCTPSSIQPELHEAVHLAVSYAVLHDIETDRLRLVGECEAEGGDGVVKRGHGGEGGDGGDSGGGDACGSTRADAPSPTAQLPTAAGARDSAKPNGSTSHSHRRPRQRQAVSHGMPERGCTSSGTHCERKYTFKACSKNM